MGVAGSRVESRDRGIEVVVEVMSSECWCAAVYFVLSGAMTILAWPGYK